MRILVVDDEKLISASVKKLLLKRGHEVVACDHMNEALTVLHDTEFDLVISDYIMPDAKGDAIIDAVRAKRDAPKVIIMSGAISPHIIKELGADAYIEKPFLMVELQRIIDSLFARAAD